MGIPTVNGALVVDPAYLANPLVFCGTVGVIPRGMSTKSVEPGDRIVAVGGRTGRDGIHGATFSSVELTGESEIDLRRRRADRQRDHREDGPRRRPPGPRPRPLPLDHRLRRRRVQLGRRRDGRAELGAEVDLDRAPLKYEGLSYTEIWISEAQERMVLAVPPENWPALRGALRPRGGRGDRPRRVRRHRPADPPLSRRGRRRPVDGLPPRRPPRRRPQGDVHAARAEADHACPTTADYTADLLAILGTWDVCSKEWIVRQYDHEVQARTVIKPLVGVHDDGPGDASVVLPVRGLDPGPGDRLRDQPALRPARPLRDGRLRDRRGGAELRGRRRRPRPDRDPRQLLLGEHRAARDPRLARPGRARAATTWPWPTARRSSRARTASTTSTPTRARAWPSRRRSSSARWARCPTSAGA